MVVKYIWKRQGVPYLFLALLPLPSPFFSTAMSEGLSQQSQLLSSILFSVQCQSKCQNFDLLITVICGLTHLGWLTWQPSQIWLWALYSSNSDGSITTLDNITHGTDSNVSGKHFQIILHIQTMQMTFVTETPLRSTWYLVKFWSAMSCRNVRSYITDFLSTKHTLQHIRLSACGTTMCQKCY